MVLVAAIAAAVLINTAGLLQQKAQTTGSEATSQTSTGVDVVSVAGFDTSAGSADGVDYANFSIKLRPGSEDVNLSKAIVVYTDDENTQELVKGDSATDTEFAVAFEQDPDDSANTMNSRDDLAVINVSMYDIRGSTLGEGESATIKIIPSTGATTAYTINVPESVTSEVVDLT